jgi:hypothetical protein
MQLLFELITICVIWCLGIKILTADGMLFQSIGKWAEKKVDEGKIIFEPLLVCPYCMPSLHTAIAIGFGFGIGIIDEFSWHLIFMYPIVAMASSFINGYVWTLHQKQHMEKDFIESATDTCNIVSDYIEDLYIQESNMEYEHQNN